MNTILENTTEILLLFFVIITFLQSGLDKIFDWSGNLNWLKGHFADTPLRNLIPFLLGTLLLMEMATGILGIVGIYQMVVIGKSSMAFYAALAACVSLLMLLLGQRIAKDYEGAKTIVIYFIPAIFLVFLL